MPSQPFQKHNTRAAKLTGEQVIAIRQRYAAGGVTQGELCREYRMSINTISKIVNGYTWAGLAMPVSVEQARASEARIAQQYGLTQPAPTAAEQRDAKAIGSLEELMAREALKDEGGGGLQKLVSTADKVLAPERAVAAFLKED